MDAVRNRPAEYYNKEATPLSPEAAALEERLRIMVEAGTAPQEVAEIVFGAIKEERFYIFPDPAVKGLIKRRMEDLIAERNPGSASR